MTKMKYWVLLAILPLFVGIMIGVSIQSSQAELGDVREQSSEPFETKWATPAAPMPIIIQVLDEDMPGFMPTLDFKDMYTFQRDDRNTYSILFGVTAGDTDLENIIIECKSDVDSIQTTVTSLSALTSTENLVRIKAMDPASITGEIISFQIAG